MNVSCIKGQTTVQTCLWKGNCPPHPHTTDEWTVINLSFLGKPNSVWLATPSPEQTKSRCVNAPKTCRGSSAVWLNWTDRSLTPMETWTKSTWSTAAASVARFKKLFTQIHKPGLVLCCCSDTKAPRCVFFTTNIQKDLTILSGSSGGALLKTFTVKLFALTVSGVWGGGWSW